MDMIPICFFCRFHYLNHCHKFKLSTDMLLEKIYADEIEVKDCFELDNPIAKLKEVR